MQSRDASALRAQGEALKMRARASAPTATKEMERTVVSQDPVGTIVATEADEISHQPRLTIEDGYAALCQQYSCAASLHEQRALGVGVQMPVTPAPPDEVCAQQ